MAMNEDFAQFVMEQMSGLRDVTLRRMFGGGGIFQDGKMFALVHEASLYLKVDEDSKVLFEERGMERFLPFKDRPMRMPYYEVPPEVLEDRDILERWSRRSIEIAHGR